MIRKIIISICLLVIIFAIGDGFTIAQAVPFAVTVDVSQDIGAIPGVLRSGLMGALTDDGTPAMSPVSYLSKKPFYRFNLEIGWDQSTVKPADFDVSFQNWLTNNVDPSLKRYQNSGYQVVISLIQVPKWLSLYPFDDCLPSSINDGCWMKWQYSPPVDYVQWKALLQLLVTTQRQDGITADYIIWDEPNWMFYGTADQYFEMYRNSVEAIKGVDPSIQVGGPGVGGWSGTKDKNCPAQITGLPDGECPVEPRSMIEDLIGYVSVNDAPLDFIDWHFPNLINFSANISATRNWLVQYGLNSMLPLTIGEWVYSSGNEDESTEKGSANAVYMLQAFADNGIYRHTATSIFDQPGWLSGDWAHVGFFSSDGVIKAKWNTFKAIDRLPNRRLNVGLGGSQGLVTAMAFKDALKTSVIMVSTASQQQISLEVNHLASGTYTVRKYLIDGDLNEIHSNPCRYNKKTEPVDTPTSACGVNGAIDQAVASARTEVGNATTSYIVSAGFPQLFADDLLACYSDPACDVSNYILTYCQANPGQCNGKKYVFLELQQLYNNLFYHGIHRINSGKVYTMSNYIDQINNLKEVSLEGSLKENQVTVTNGTYTENIDMLPYSVMLIELSK